MTRLSAVTKGRQQQRAGRDPAVKNARIERSICVWAFHFQRISAGSHVQFSWVEHYPGIRRLVAVTRGAIHSTKISGNFGPKLNGSVRSNRKSFGKTGPPFEVVLFSRSDRSEFWLNGSRPRPQRMVGWWNKWMNKQEQRFNFASMADIQDLELRPRDKSDFPLQAIFISNFPQFTSLS